ncbi:MAG: hypothetical protein AAF600_02580 [Bacteroidota bacterium]
MANFEYEDLEYIRENSLRIDGVKSLMEERDNALEDLNKQKQVSYHKYEPNLTPENDFTPPKTYKSKGLNNEEFTKKHKEIKDNYNEKIFNTTKEYFELNAPEGDSKMVEDLGKQDFTTLLEENGVQKVSAIKKERAEKENLDITMDTEKSNEIFNELERTEPNMDTVEKNVPQDKDIDLDITMDEETSNRIFNQNDFTLEEFKENYKDMETDKRPSPSDDFE